MDQFHKPNGTGKVQGDTRHMPDRGTGTGSNGGDYGADLSQDATNRHGSLGGAAKSDKVATDSTARTE